MGPSPFISQVGELKPERVSQGQGCLNYLRVPAGLCTECAGRCFRSGTMLVNAVQDTHTVSAQVAHHSVREAWCKAVVTNWGSADHWWLVRSEKLVTADLNNCCCIEGGRWYVPRKGAAILYCQEPL